MLAKQTPVATLPVKNLAKARRFYEDVLGLPVKNEMSGVEVTYDAGQELFVYESKFAGGNDGTAVTWMVDEDIAKLVADLRGKGVTFEHYDDMEGLKRDGDLHRGGGMTVAWFKDPDGNIHSLVNG